MKLQEAKRIAAKMKQARLNGLSLSDNYPSRNGMPPTPRHTKRYRRNKHWSRQFWKWARRHPNYPKVVAMKLVPA